MAQVRVTVDGVNYADDVEPRMLLVYYLRERLGKTGTLVGCDTSNCGACTVHLNGQSVKSCSVLAVQADGGEVTTIEGIARDGKLHPVQEAFREHHALQCGYCTPGMIMQAIDLLGDNPDPDEREVREGIEGNLCRCTGYQNIVRAIQGAAQKMKPGADQARRRATACRWPEEATEMTTTAEPTTPRDRQGPGPQGGRAADHRAHPLDRQHQPQRACCTSRWCAARSRTAGSPGSTSTRPSRCPAWSPSTPAPTSTPSSPACPAAGRSTPRPPRRGTSRSPWTPCASPVRSSPSWWPATPASAKDATEAVEVDYDPIDPVLDMEAALGRRLRRGPPRSRQQQVGDLPVRLGRRRHHLRADRRRRHRRRRGRPRLGRGQAPVAAAAADPGVHGAPLRGRRPDRRAADHVVVHPGAAHPAHDARAHPRPARAEAAGDRPRRGRRLRRQAAGASRRRSSPCWWPAGWASRSSGPRPVRSRWCRPTTAATRSRTSRSPPSGTAASPR